MVVVVNRPQGTTLSLYLSFFNLPSLLDLPNTCSWESVVKWPRNQQKKYV